MHAARVALAPVLVRALEPKPSPRGHPHLWQQFDFTSRAQPTEAGNLSTHLLSVVTCVCVGVCACVRVACVDLCALCALVQWMLHQVQLQVRGRTYVRWVLGLGLPRELQLASRMHRMHIDDGVLTQRSTPSPISLRDPTYCNMRWRTVLLWHCLSVKRSPEGA